MNRIKMAQQGVPDQVPIYGQIHEFAMAQSGVSAKEFYTNGTLLVESIVETAQQYGLDDPHVDYDTYNIEAEAMGMEVRYYDHQAPQLVQSKPLIQEKSDLDHLRPPTPGEDGRMPFVVEVFEAYQKAVDTPKWHPSMSYTAPFTLATRVRGVEAFLMDTVLDPSFVHAVLSFLTDEVLIPWIQMLKEVNKKDEPIVGGADALASPPLLKVEAMREFALPYLLRIRNACGWEGVVQNYWGESIIDPPEILLDFKRDASPKVILAMDPDVEKIGPEIFKRYVDRHGMTLTLGLGADFLAIATPKQIKERIRKYIEVGGMGGKFLLYLCNAAANTPPENLKAAVEAVQAYGVYENGALKSAL
ncbi:MAG: uroporphyrinogen decarboxylase family protein, partial [Candidatus Bipolaricaulia bacterium]